MSKAGEQEYTFVQSLDVLSLLDTAQPGKIPHAPATLVFACHNSHVETVIV